MTTPILLFAAGFGTRMGALTKTMPKPLIPVSGKPLIDHALALCSGQPLGPKVVNLHYKGDMIRKHLQGTDILFSDESTEILETGGGLKKALPILGGSPVITLNTDAVWQGMNPIEMLLAAWQPAMKALLLTVPKSQVHGHLGKGDFDVAKNGQLSRGTQEIYTGLQMIRAETLLETAEKSFSMNVIWDKIAADGGLYGLSYCGNWCDVGQPDSIVIAEQMIAKQHV